MACDAGYMHVYIYQNENQTAKQKNHCTVHLQYTDYFLSYFFFCFWKKGPHANCFSIQAWTLDRPAPASWVLEL